MSQFFKRFSNKHILLAASIVIMVSACSNSDTANSVEAIKKPLPELESAGGKLLIEYCSECHAPPHPSQLARGDWKSTVLRMRDHRTYQGYNTLSDDEVITLTEYLDKYASEKL